MSEKLTITPEQQIDTAELRMSEVFSVADPSAEVPNVVLAPVDPLSRPNRSAQPLGIHNAEGAQVGSFNLVQAGERAWINNVAIPEAEHQNKRYAVSAYLAVMATLHEAGRTLESDPQGLSEDSVRVWESLVRRGVAQPVEGQYDVHGNQRYASRSAEQPLT